MTPQKSHRVVIHLIIGIWIWTRIDSMRHGSRAQSIPSPTYIRASKQQRPSKSQSSIRVSGKQQDSDKAITRRSMEMDGESAAVSPSPLLPVLVHDLGTGTDDSSQTHYSISTKTLTTAAAMIPELRDHRCFETPQGWVLALHPSSLQTFLWRPQDSTRIPLPPLKEPLPLRCKCLLSTNNPSNSSSSSCSVVVFDLDSKDMWVCKIGSATKWSSYGYSFDRERHIAKAHGIAAAGGKIYHELTGYELGAIEFDPAPRLGGRDIDMVDLPLDKPMASTYLVESRGDLFLAVVFFDGDNFHKVSEFRVYRMDRSSETKPAWREVDRIGDDRVFLLGRPAPLMTA